MSTLAFPNLNPPLRALGETISGKGRRHRRLWKGNGRAHIEVRGMHRPDSDHLARQLQKALESVEGIQWAQVNGVIGRVVISFEDDGPGLDQVLEIIEGVEELHDVHDDRFPHTRPELPSDSEPITLNAIALGGDILGIGVAFSGLLLRIPPIPGELGSLVSFIDNERRIRGSLEKRLGRQATDLSIGLTSAAVHAITEGPLNLMVDAFNRASQIGEIQARRRLWESREPSLSGNRALIALDALVHEPRPCALPAGPIEKYSDRAQLGGIGAFGITLATTKDPRRAFNAFSAGLPKAARLGREAFAAQVGREMADRGILVMDPRALRLLDRIDTVLIDPDAMRIGRTRGGVLDPLADVLAAKIHATNHLFVVAGSKSSIAKRLDPQRIVPGGTHLAHSIRELQQEGRVVLLIANSRDHAGMRAADLAVANFAHGPCVPWGADLICGPGLDDIWFVIEATESARQLSRSGIAISAAGSAIGGVWSIVGPSTRASRRTSLAVNSSALLAQGLGTVSALNLGRKRAPVPPSDVAWHEMETSQVIEALTTCVNGLDEQEATKRELPDPSHERRSNSSRFGHAVLGELANPLTPVLGLGVGLSAAVGSMTDAVLVGGVVATNALVGGFQRLRTELSLERLARVSGSLVGVRRSGETIKLESSRLVRGDIVELSAGDVVPADCRILESLACEVDESSLTGESLPVTKQSAITPGATVGDRSCMVFEGTTLVNGTALAVVVATGNETQAGQALNGAPEPPASGVEERLRSLTAITVPATIASGAAVTGISLLHGRSLRTAVSSGVSLMVAAVPEGLPLLATIAQLGAARRLSQRQALVRNPRTIEALGRVDVLCFDKTGTLTAGEISIQKVSDGTNDESINTLSPLCRSVLAGALRATPKPNGDEQLLHATDRSVIEGAGLAGVSPNEGVGSWKPLGELPFEPVRGYHCVWGKIRSGHLIAVKGAPEVVLPRCSTWRTHSGTQVLDSRKRKGLEAQVERFARQGLRVLAVAQLRESSQSAFDEENITKMEFVGFLCLADPVRPEAAQAVRNLRIAGVEVVMITGDHASTAEAIASELGIVNGKGVMTGPNLDLMDDDELDANLPSTSVFARVTPAHKVRIVRAYQRLGRTVAMTGDGANDAGAIRLAHVGIALGQRGSQSAIEAADVVVTDDRIETIIDAIVEGRAMWASVRDALAILVGGNLGEVGFTICATALSGRSPLDTRQLLLVNLLTDMLPAMTITLRPPAKKTPLQLLHEGPDASLGGALITQIAIRALATGAGATGAWTIARSTGRGKRASTIALAALVGSQLGQTAAIGARSPLVLGSTVISAATLIAIIQTPGVSQFFGCTPLGPIGWTIASGASAAATGGSIIASWVVDK